MPGRSPTARRSAETVIVRAADIDATYLSFRTIGVSPAPGPVVHRVQAGRRQLAVRALLGAVPAQGSNDRLAIKRSMKGPLTDLARESALSAELGALLIPPDVVRRLVERSPREPRPLWRITPSPSLTAVPFELLIVGGRRLLDLVDICYEPPSLVRATRARTPRAWRPDAPTLYIVDPSAPPGSGLLPTLSPAGRAAFTARVASMSTPGSVVGDHLDRVGLHEELDLSPSRLFYVGHVSAADDEPGSAALHLSDDDIEWGLAHVVNGSHRPFTALDLLLGTAHPDLGEGQQTLPTAPGHELWPMPPRIAIIACDGGSDYRASETFGLVTALANAGAELVTTTRWSLPTDAAFRDFGRVDDEPGPTTALALAVDDAHASAEPERRLLDWQRAKLAVWTELGRIVDSPLSWAAVGNHVCREWV